MLYFDSYYFILVLPALLIGMWAQLRIQSSYNKFSRVRSAKGYTGAQVARMILDDNGLRHVQVEGIRGNLTDHYDPRSQVVRLSETVYGNPSIAAIGVAAHEVGHAIQHANNYAPLTMRNAIIPITNIGSRLSVPLILLGYFMGLEGLVTLGILGFSMMTLFQLITLPVEFNASSRALTTLERDGFLYDDEMDGARRVLSAAALTYVAALLTSVAQLLRLILLYGRRNRRN